MVDWLCCGFCKPRRANPNVVTAIVASGHQPKTKESSQTRKDVATPLNLKLEKLSLSLAPQLRDTLSLSPSLQQRNRLCLSPILQPRITFPSPKPTNRSASMIRISYPFESSASLELIEGNLSPTDEVSTLYSSTTGDCSQRKDRYVTYRVSPNSTSKLPPFSPAPGGHLLSPSLSGNTENSTMYSITTGIHSQKKERYYRYPRVSPNNSTSPYSSMTWGSARSLRVR